MNPLNSNSTNQRGMSFGQLYSQVMKDPSGFLSKIGIPQNISTPEGAVQYLLQSGKVTQEQVNQAQDMVKQLPINNRQR